MHALVGCSRCRMRAAAYSCKVPFTLSTQEKAQNGERSPLMCDSVQYDERIPLQGELEKVLRECVDCAPQRDAYRRAAGRL